MSRIPAAITFNISMPSSRRSPTSSGPVIFLKSKKVPDPAVIDESTLVTSINVFLIQMADPNFSRASFSPSAITRTVASGRFWTMPVRFISFARETTFAL
jgi:hypothetical protein